MSLKLQIMPAVSIAIAEGLEKSEIIHAVLSRHLVTAFLQIKKQLYLFYKKPVK